jgi:hypothetical protein
MMLPTHLLDKIKKLKWTNVTNTGLLGSTHVLAVRPWHKGCLLHLVALLPRSSSLDLLSYFNDTSMIRPILAS